MKTYVLTVSRNFQTTHLRKGEETGFIGKILNGVKYDGIYKSLDGSPDTKIHTIRANYHLWKKRIDEVNEGEAILSVRYWSVKPYHSKQLRIVELGKDSGVGVQKLIGMDLQYWMGFVLHNEHKDEQREIEFSITHSIQAHTIAENDGLSYEDFKSWFKGYNLSQPMAIIHFTSFRY